MSKEKIKSKYYISKESVLYHNELPDEVVNKIKHLIDNANSNDERFDKVKEIYKEQIDAAVSLIKDGYKIDVFVDDENDISSYVFVGYIYRENLSDDEQESKKQKVEFNDKIEQLSYYGFVKDSDDRSNKNVKEMLNTLKELLVKEGTPYNKKQISILPVILINQYISYGSMLKLNSNMYDYYYNKIDEFATKEYCRNETNPYILFITDFRRMLNKQINGENVWGSENYKNYIEISEFNIKSVNGNSEFDSDPYNDGISFDILKIIATKEKYLNLFIPVNIEADSSKIGNLKTKHLSDKNVSESKDNQMKDVKDDNNVSKYELRMSKTTYYDENWDDERNKSEKHINVYNINVYNYRWWEEEEKESTKLDDDFCKTSFKVHYINEINVGLLEIGFSIRFISPLIIINQLDKFHIFNEATYIEKDIINNINKYNMEREPKIKPFDDLEYNHYLLINNYYSYSLRRIQEDKYYLSDITNIFESEINHAFDIYVSDNDKYYLGKKIGLNIGWSYDERTFHISLLKYFIINNLSNSLTEELIRIKNNRSSIKNSENIFLNFDKKYLDYSMLSTRDLYSSNIDYSEIEECDKKFHIDEIDTQYKKNMAMYKEIVDFESKKKGNDLANKLNTIQIMSILLTIIGWGLVIAQANILNKTLNYFILIIFAAISGLLVAIFINNFISKR